MGKGARPRRDPSYPPFTIRYSLICALIAGLLQAALAQEQPAQFVDAATVVPGLRAP